jgi:hypothetical protein
MLKREDNNDIAALEKQINELLQAAGKGRPSIDLLDALSLWADLVFHKAIQSGSAPFDDQTVASGISLVNNPVFVCGVHRSGTTLVRDLLDDHPQLVVLPSEGSFITSTELILKRTPPAQHREVVCKEWLKRLANPINKAPYWLLGRSSATASPYIQFAKQFIAWWDILQLRKSNSFTPLICVLLAYAAVTDNIAGKKYWVEKTPTNEQHLKRLRKEFPGAKFIHVIRNPVDVLASRMKMQSWTKFRKFLPDLQASYDIALRESSLNDADYRLLKYEDICDSPEQFTREIAGFLGINSSHTLTLATVAGISTSPNSSFDTALTSGHIHKFQNVKKGKLTASQLELASAYLASSARSLGYEMKELSPLQNLCTRIKNLF